VAVTNSEAAPESAAVTNSEAAPESGSAPREAREAGEAGLPRSVHQFMCTHRVEAAR